MRGKFFDRSLRDAAAGGMAWLILLSLPISDSFEGELIQRILLLGVLVIVPLGMALINSISEFRSWFFGAAVRAQPFAALAVIVSTFLDPGVPAAGFATWWLILTSLIGLDGLVALYRIRSSGLSSIANISLIAGMVYLPVGAVWLIMSRLSIQPLGFGDTIVLLTAVHFHFAGFAAPLLTALTGNFLQPTGKARRLFAPAVLCVIAGTPLVAMGITFSPGIALVGALVISLGLFCLTVINLIWVMPRLSSRFAQILLMISCITNVPAMVLAIVYAYTIVFHKLIVDIPQMAMTHGVANAFGFALCGLVAWVMVMLRPLGR